MMVRYSMTSAEMWARSVAPKVYSVYMMRRSWSTSLRARAPISPRAAISRLTRIWVQAGRGDRNWNRVPTSVSPKLCALSTGQGRCLDGLPPVIGYSLTDQRSDEKGPSALRARDQSKARRRSTWAVSVGSLETKITDQGSSLSKAFEGGFLECLAERCVGSHQRSGSADE